ncbi:SDR family NAD(P)-dependent oxidoreductase [Salinisphaera aquimarina]|uniref:SDR family NAD(P)-dependent oxidoreductase n=1 Tax=Salinisphaera aquimarina TaxID=2094031 RepID=A0ABV7EI85_9GAMM
MGVTLLTGASSGIGRSLARRLAAGGEAMALVARRDELLASLVMEIEAAGGKALALPCDVTDRVALANAVDIAESQLGPVTRLVANAGGGEPTDATQFDAGVFESVVRLNLVGVANAVAAVLPGMLARGDGHLVATGSLAGCRGLPSAAAYSAAKGGLANLMDSLRIDLRGHGIAVTLLMPGFVRPKPKKPGGSRGKPFRVDLEVATARMENAILARRRRLIFPWSLALAIGLTRLLPFGIDEWLLAGRGRTAGTRRNEPPA